MGLLMRRRRPLMRVAGAAALGTVAYQSGKRHEEAQEQQQQGAYEQAPAPAPVAPVAPAPVAASPTDDPTAELEKLAQLHSSGALSDDEFSAAKAKLLGI
jgi:uncharacterized membrane protein YebE (DUF533 family)